MQQVLCCDEQVTPKEHGAGISSLIICQCHQREFSQCHFLVSRREGTTTDLSRLLLMKMASVTPMEYWSPGRGMQEADA